MIVGWVLVVIMACMMDQSKALVEPDWSVQFAELMCLMEESDCPMFIENV